MPRSVPCPRFSSEKRSGRPSDDEDELDRERHAGDRDREPVEARAAHEAHRGHDDDHSDPDEDIGGALGQGLPAERVTQVVRDEERRERDHDQVVEEDGPAGEEPELVVERPPDEGRGAARLRDRGGSLGVGERDEEEEHADAEQHPRREAERVERDDAEREEERRRDLAEGDRRQRGSLEDALEAGELSSHGAGQKGTAAARRRGSGACRGGARARRRRRPAIVRTTITIPSTIIRPARNSCEQGLRGPATGDHGDARRRVPQHVVDGPAEDRLAAAHLRPRRSEDDDLRVAAPCLLDDRGPGAAGTLETADDAKARVRLEERLRLVEDLVADRLPLAAGRRRAAGRAAPRSRAGGRSSPGARTRGARPRRAPPPTRRSADTGTRIVRYSISSPSTIAGARTVSRSGIRSTRPPVDRVAGEADREPAQPDPARGRLLDDDDDPGDAGAEAAEEREQRPVDAAEAEVRPGPVDDLVVPQLARAAPRPPRARS